jgi:ABC-type uncharacterized transport system substrate-binding protein
MRKTVISFALAPLFSSSLGAAADENPSDRIGSTSVSARTEAFRQGLRELGVEGKNIVIEWRRHEGKVDRLPALATELVRLKVDVIVVTGVGDLRSANEATATIPIVMVVEVVSSPVWRKTPDASRMPDVPRPRPPALTTAASL